MNKQFLFVSFLCMSFGIPVNGCCNYCLDFFGCKDDEIVEKKVSTKHSFTDPLQNNVVSVSTCQPLTLTQVARQGSSYMQSNTVPVGDVIILENLKKQYRQGKVFTEQDLHMYQKDTPEYRFIAQCIWFSHYNV